MSECLVKRVDEMYRTSIKPVCGIQDRSVALSLNPQNNLAPSVLCSHPIWASGGASVKLHCSITFLPHTLCNAASLGSA